ncbi:uncharacterized protein B0J16DRAFT_367919 [Fusarium flagelliforme]|uniref:uncharacterized protein n=1 Tax=Fusarium flagelliforme TaxID=2675880 RepID=UPI001E8ED486|nr:uncharacterized protein B0J16DRAFT_367919 [Fusarium flagelliforme]KAH7198915.1 hypothetical protein B0J16DRAFT_367919 [Fusarium flagelliforme]
MSYTSASFSTFISSDVQVSTPKAGSNDESNLLAFLATVQALKIHFVPIFWDGGRPTIGSGATSMVHESFVNRNTSFAFKRVNRNKSERHIYDALICEIVILSVPCIEKSANIGRLLGVCWDISSRDNIPWPVLIFEKSRHGDLRTFLDSNVGRELTFPKRLRLCLDIGKGISILHQSGIVHGDIKPENILIFDKEGDYQAKVIDFGYSSLYSKDECDIRLPISYPWNPPEHDRPAREWTATQAKFVDNFSFGMITLWLLFAPYLTRQIPLPPDIAIIVERALPKTDPEELVNEIAILGRLKESGDGLLSFSLHLLAEVEGPDEQQRHCLRSFFSSSLSACPEKREASMERLLARLECDICPESIIHEVAQRRFACDFKVLKSLNDFYQCDFRVRSHIFHLLSDHHLSDPDSVYEQLAICYYLGFGTTKNEVYLRDVLRGRRQSTFQIEEAVKSWEATTGAAVRNDRRDPDVNDSPNRLKGHGLTQYRVKQLEVLHTSATMDPTFAESFMSAKKPTARMDHLLKDINNLKQVFSPGHRILNNLRLCLAVDYVICDRHEDAEQMCCEALNLIVVEHGEVDIDAFRARELLSEIYIAQSRHEEAERLLLQEMGIISKNRFGPVDREDSAQRLANIYTSRGRPPRAVLKVQTRNMRKSERTQGKESIATQQLVYDLAATFFELGEWQEAQRLVVEVVGTTRNTFGEKHPMAMLHTYFLAKIYAHSGQWDKILKLGPEALDAAETSFGAEHFLTIDIAAWLAFAYSHEGKLADASDLAVKVSETLLSAEEEDPQRLCEYSSLFGILDMKRGRWKEAEQLFIAILEQSKTVCGKKQRITRLAMANLAEAYIGQKRWDAAEELYIQLLTMVKERLAETHPESLRCRQNLAALYEKQKNWKGALDMYIELLTIEEGSDEYMPARQGWLKGLAVVLRKLGLEWEARDLEGEALEPIGGKVLLPY